MNNKILFIVMNGEIKFLQNSTMDHKEWFLSMGGNIEEYDNVIRGYVMDNMIIYFKANLNYDNEVIEFATKTGLLIKKQLNHPEYKICCGINPGHDGMKWEPILVLNDSDLEGYKTEEQILEEQKKEEQKKQLEEMRDTSNEPVIQFKNNTEDPKFIKKAVIFTIIMMIIAILVKIVMIKNKTMMTSNRYNTLLIIVQMGGFLLTIIGYLKKMSKAKYYAVAASIASIFMFDIADIIIGIINIFFTMDYTTFLKILESIKNLMKKKDNKPDVKE